MGSHAVPPFMSVESPAGAGPKSRLNVLARALDTPWLATIQPNDLRFGFRGADTLLELAQRIDRGEAALDTNEARSTLRRALSAADNTYAQDMRDVGGFLALKRYRSAARADWRVRFVDAFVRRAGCGDGDWTLDAIARLYAVTPGAVRRLLDRGLQAAADVSISCSSVFHLEQQLATLLPLPYDECRQAVGDLLGAPVALEGVLQFIEEVQRKPPPFTFRDHLAGGDKTRLVEPAQASVAWHGAAWSIAQWCCEACGGAQVDFVAGRVMFERGGSLDRDRFVAMLQAHPHFRWLSKETGWFTVDDPARPSSVMQRVARIIAVAQRPVDVDEISTAVRSDWRVGRVRPAYAVPLPPFALRAWLASLPWLRAHLGNKFLPSPLFDAAAALSDVDRALVAAIEQRQGVATRNQILQVLQQTCGLKPVAASVALATAPYVQVLGHALFTLIGRDIAPTALAAAIAARTASAHGVPASDLAPVDGAVFSWRLRVTAASVRADRYCVPRRALGLLTPGRHPIRGSDAQVTVYRSGVMLGAHPYFGDVLRPGDLIEVRAFADGSVALSSVLHSRADAAAA